MKNCREKEKVKEIYKDEQYGIVFVTGDNKKWTYQYFRDALNAIYDIDLVAVPKGK